VNGVWSVMMVLVTVTGEWCVVCDGGAGGDDW